jgi:hypothetical protein
MGSGMSRGVCFSIRVQALAWEGIRLEGLRLEVVTASVAVSSLGTCK